MSSVTLSDVGNDVKLPPGLAKSYTEERYEKMKKKTKKMETRKALLSVLLITGLACAGVGTVAATNLSLQSLPQVAWLREPSLSAPYRNIFVGADPGTWLGTDAVNDALTEGTENISDDEGSEFVHEIQWEAAGMDPTSFNTTQEALAFATDEIVYVSDYENYGVNEAWTNAEQTLKKGSGDCEDKAILLASLLKFHTEEVTAGEDLIFVMVAPSYSALHAQVVWKDSETWYLLDPTSGDINEIAPLSIGTYGTLWFNDETVQGWLSGYYEPQGETPDPEAPWYPPQQFEFRRHQNNPQQFEGRHQHQRNLYQRETLVPQEVPGFQRGNVPQLPEDTNLTYELTISNGTVTLTENGEAVTTTQLLEGEEFVYRTTSTIYLQVGVSLDAEGILASIEAKSYSTYCRQTFSRAGDIDVIIEVQGNAIYLWGQ